MKKIVLFLLLAIAMLTACTAKKDGSYEVSANGYGGELVLKVEFDEKTIKNITVVSSKESAPVFARAFLVIKQRILDEQSPMVDSVSGATISSFAVKTAVAKAMEENGQKAPTVTFSTGYDTEELVKIDDVDTQIVIVGAGPAGLAAAISARESGIEDVILVEKLDILSGNGKFDMNFFDHYNTQAQKESGTLMTKEEFLASKESSTDSDARKQAWADEGNDLDIWLRSMDINLDYTYGGTTSHMAKSNEYAGDYVQQGLENRVVELGVDVRTGTEGVDLVIEDGKAIGVKVTTRDSYYTINADAIILTTGGFSYNKEMLAKYVPGSEIVATSNQMGATGDFVPVFEAHNLKMTNMDVLSVFRLIIKHRRDLTGAGDGFILVNNNGERFVAENLYGLPVAYKILEQPNGEVFYIYDQNLYESFYRLKKHNDLGYHIKADTLEELAEKLEINAENLIASVDTFNKAIRGEIEDPFIENVFTREITSEGPYYGVQVESAIHMTKGGVLANEKAEVLNNDDEVVKGLYAAGEVTSTSGAYSAAVVFGKIAGREAALMIMSK